jgi:hypothetical protein
MVNLPLPPSANVHRATNESAEDHDGSDEPNLSLKERPKHPTGSATTLDRNSSPPSTRSRQTHVEEEQLSRKRWNSTTHGEWIKTFEVRSGTKVSSTGKHDCFDIEARTLLDTGTTVNVACPKFVDQVLATAKAHNHDDGIELLPLPADECTALTTATNEPFPLENWVYLDIKPTDCSGGHILQSLANKVYWKVIFYVAKEPLSLGYDLIIGTDTMMVMGAAVGKTARGSAVAKWLKLVKRNWKLIRRRRALVLHPPKKESKLGRIMVNHFFRARVKGLEGKISS